jgi:hypothetical protein
MNKKFSYRVPVVSRLIVTTLLLLVSTYGWSLDLETVLENAAVTPPSRVGFVEQRFNRLLKEPMVLTGYLEYVETGQLRKVIETPFAEAFFITEDYIEIERNGKTRRLSLRKSKPMRAMFGGIEAILAGQVDKLTALFRYELSGTNSAWTIRLEPLSRRVSAQLTSMLVEGDEDSANSIRLELKDGEWSLMELLHTKPES